MKAGLFITFEGGEGAGKTTLIEEVARTLASQGLTVLKVREPGGTGLGEDLRTLLLQHKGPISPYAELALFLASRAEHIFEVIAPALKEGKIVLCDRFNDSSIAYQGKARALGVEKVAQMCDFISEGLKPALTLYLDLDPKVGLSRAAKARAQDRIEAEKLSFHQKIREAYLSIHRAEPSRFCLIDAASPPDQVFQQAMKYLRPLLSTYV
jgi:dTMP kinase